MSDSPPATTRRQLVLGAVGVTAVAAATLVALRRDEPSMATLGPLAVGDVLGGATIVAIHGVYLGAIPIVLRTPSGVLFQVDVLARDPEGPAGVAETAQFSLFVANQGDGATATDEIQGLCVMALAGQLRDVGEIEGAGLLLTLRERNERHPEGSFGIPLS